IFPIYAAPHLDHITWAGGRNGRRDQREIRAAIAHGPDPGLQVPRHGEHRHHGRDAPDGHGCTLRVAPTTVSPAASASAIPPTSGNDHTVKLPILVGPTRRGVKSLIAVIGACRSRSWPTSYRWRCTMEAENASSPTNSATLVHR